MFIVKGQIVEDVDCKTRYGHVNFKANLDTTTKLFACFTLDGPFDEVKQDGILQPNCTFLLVGWFQ